jgi:hypothetical protein
LVSVQVTVFIPIPDAVDDGVPVVVVCGRVVVVDEVEVFGLFPEPRVTRPTITATTRAAASTTTTRRRK